ncbi:MAG: urease accessory protein UreE [Alphaproteobacteria bacterium]|nr:urease accessory protein UreE [Alphaproteobacteria bacterium]
MLRATAIIPAGQWPAGSATGRITLAFEDRFRRRVRMRSDDGIEFLLDLPEARLLEEGDALRLEDGRLIEVRAAAEDLVEIKVPTGANLACYAWHLGNRHLPAAIEADRILIRDDHVIVDMLRRLGAVVRAVRLPFRPEGGAYGQHNHDPSQHHRHDHDHDHDHGQHGHRHDH